MYLLERVKYAFFRLILSFLSFLRKQAPYSMRQSKHPIYNLPVSLLAISTFLFFASFNMLIPELPSHLTALGGAQYKGLIIGLFTVTAGISRPFSGKLADTIGRVPVMAIGSLVCFVCGFWYPLLNTVMGFLVLRLVHGFSTGFKPTGTSAYVADLVPATHRGEAMGILGLSGSIGMAIGPAIGSELTRLFSLNAMFYCSSFFALLSILILLGMKETLEHRESFKWKLLRLSKTEIYEPRVFAPSLVVLLTSVGFGVVLTITPDFSLLVGINNKGLFFTVFTVSSLLVRFVAGKMTDRYGRVPVLKISSLLLAVALALAGFAQSPFAFLLAAVIFGIAQGMNSPAVSAWTIDLSHQAYRGRAMATMYIALEIGIGAGALLAGWIYSNDPTNIPATFFMAAAFSLAAWLFLLSGWRVKVVEPSAAEIETF